jgi:hypothetical protein
MDTKLDQVPAQGPLYVELVLQNYVQWISCTKVYLHLSRYCRCSLFTATQFTITVYNRLTNNGCKEQEVR